MIIFFKKFKNKFEKLDTSFNNNKYFPEKNW